MSALELLQRRRLPLILQTEMAECGLASLAMVAAYHGHKIDLNGLRQRYALSLKGATLADLMTIGGTLSFSCRPLRLELSYLPRLAMPCILHWDLNHYVVLNSVNGDRVVIHDPALGVRSMAMSEVSRHFSGVALELQPTHDFKPQALRIGARMSDLWSRIVGWKEASAVADRNAFGSAATVRSGGTVVSSVGGGRGREACPEPCSDAAPAF